jgi:hypothetical protein
MDLYMNQMYENSVPEIIFEMNGQQENKIFLSFLIYIYIYVCVCVCVCVCVWKHCHILQ